MNKMRRKKTANEAELKRDELARQYPEGIPAEVYLKATWSPEYDRIEKEANDLFSELNDGTQTEDDVWAEVWRIMDERQSRPEPAKVSPNRLNTDIEVFKQRGTGLGRQTQAPQFGRVPADRF